MREISPSTQDLCHLAVRSQLGRETSFNFFVGENLDYGVIIFLIRTAPIMNLDINLNQI